MDCAEMDRILADIGLSRAALARTLGIAPHTVSRWKAVPKYAEAWLRMARRIDQAWREIGKEKRR